MSEVRPKPAPPNQADQLVAWLLEAAHELQNAHETLDQMGAARVNPATGNEMTLAARIAVEPALDRRDHAGALLFIRGLCLGNGPTESRQIVNAINEVVGYAVFGDFEDSPWVRQLQERS